MLRFAASAEEVGQRLDSAVAARAGAPRATAQRWIRAGLVRVDTARARSSRRLRCGERIEVALPPTTVASPPPSPLSPPAPEPLALRILYEDDALLVIDKPAGLVVHPAPGHPDGTLVNGLLHHCGELAARGGVLRPGIVHRLDRGTSGVLVAAKRDWTHRALVAQFRDHRIERSYLALVARIPETTTGRVDRPVGRNPRDRKRMSAGRVGGRPAATRWRLRQRFPRTGVALLEVLPETGRTHQIRVHLAAIGLPVVADPVYGRGGERHGLERPALHASRLGFTHPETGAWRTFEAPLADDFARATELLQRSDAPS